jgi:hypothetical protein
VDDVTLFSAQLPENMLYYAKIGLQLPAGLSRAGVIRAVLAFAAGETRDEILRQAGVKSETNLDVNPHVPVSARVPTALMEKARQAFPDLTVEGRQSHAFRIACVRAAHPEIDRDIAEEYARMQHGGSRRKTTAA